MNRHNCTILEERIIKLWNYLEDGGPTSQRELSEKFNISSSTISKYIKEFPDIFERFKFCGGGRKYKASEIYGDLLYNKSGFLISLRDDPRLIDYLVEKISFKINDPTDVRIFIIHLKEQIGIERARELARKKYNVFIDVYTGKGIPCEVCQKRRGKVISKVDGKIICMNCWKSRRA